MTYAIGKSMLLFLAASVSASSESALSVAPNQETYMRILEEALATNHNNDAHSRFRFGGAQGGLGDRCGGPYDAECNEEDELSCTQSVVGRRCLPNRNNCIQREMKKFQTGFGDIQEYKRIIFAEANVTEVDIFEARRIHRERGGNDRDFAQSAPVKSLITAMKANPGKFMEVEQLLPSVTQNVTLLSTSTATCDDYRRILP